MPRNHVLHQWRSTSNSLEDEQTVFWKNVEIRRVSWATTNQLSHESHVTSSKTSLQETGYVSCWKKVFSSSPFLPIATTQTAAAADVFTSCTSDNHRWTFSVFYYLAIYTAVSFSSNPILCLLGSRSSAYLQRYECHFLLNLNTEMRPNVNYLYHEKTANTFPNKLFL